MPRQRWVSVEKRKKTQLLNNLLNKFNSKIIWIAKMMKGKDSWVEQTWLWGPSEDSAAC